jgi:hypothetical protein
MTHKNDLLQPPAPRLLYSRSEAARQLSISVRSLDYLIANKTFQTRRIGKKVLIPHGELVRYARADHFEPVATRDKPPRVPVASDVRFPKPDKTGTEGD